MIKARQCLIVLLGFFMAGALAAVASAEEREVVRYVSEIELETEADLGELLGRAENLFTAGELPQEEGAALTLVLHGPVLRSLMRENYAGSKPVVDQAASLSALGVVQFKACRSWMGSNGVDEESLQPFVTTVSYGPGEVQRLVREQGYIYF
ncbi:acyl-CoA transferase [Halioglobus maricola]|uniref:Acyl-CoA transferase n=1 Tax=Halioglobus maricola TaxID=2601894 RepID=A0A5P9NFG7_9GAMM|nr:acyl-CoA transferase [Halioglobus maricola]QFU74520.1 acyl-CoA transferase [Halioglobus maricola]